MPVAAADRWPPVVRAALARAREGIDAGVPGRVLDLGAPGARAVVEEAGRQARRSAPRPTPAARFDLVVSVADLVGYPDLDATARGIVHLLADDGELRFVEPTSSPGMSALLLGSLTAGHPALRDCHLNRDVAGTLRAAGLDIAALDYRYVATAMWPLRKLARGRARHALQLDGSEESP